MNQVHQRLLEELTILMRDREVYTNLDENIKQRAQKIIYESDKQNVKDLWEGDQNLFARKQSEDLSLQFHKIVLKGDYQQKNQPKCKFSYDAPKRVSCNKNFLTRGNIKKNQRSRINSNSSKKVISRSKDKGLKQINHCNSQAMSKNNSRDKHHSKEKNKNGKTIENQILKDNSQGRRLKTEKENMSLSKQDRFQTQSSVRKKQSQTDRQFIFTKNQPSKDKTNGKDVLKKLAAIDPHSFISSSSSRKKTEKSLEKQMRSLEFMNIRQQQMLEEKKKLCELMKQMKFKIIAQKQRLKNSNIHVAMLQNQIFKIQTREKGKTIEIDLKKKKSNEFEVKEEEITKKIKENDLLNGNISEEKELIGMYNTVLAEMNSQLHIELSARNKLKKQMQFLKNQQKMLYEQFQQKEVQSDELFSQLTTLVRHMQ